MVVGAIVAADERMGARAAVSDDANSCHPATTGTTRLVPLSPSPRRKARSLSDGEATPAKLSPSPLIVEASRKTSRDDSSLGVGGPPPKPFYRPDNHSRPPVTSRRLTPPSPALSLQVPRRELSTPKLSTQTLGSSQRQHQPPQQPDSGWCPARPTPPPPSPRLVKHQPVYSSPTNILPRRSRGLDFSRAATSLHHSTLAEQSSPDSSPTVCSGGCGDASGLGAVGSTTTTSEGGRGRAPAGNDGTASTAGGAAASLWSIMGPQERMNLSSSVGSAAGPGLGHGLAMGSDSSSDDDDGADMMDEDMDDACVGTPVAASKVDPAIGQWSPANNSMLSFQQRRRLPRKAPARRMRGPLGLGFPSTSASAMSRSPPNGIARDLAAAHPRRESISWQANRLHISGAEAEEAAKHGGADVVDGSLGGRDGQQGVIRKVVTRRGNLLPKTKTFARIRAALAEEGAPIEAEFRREAEVVRQVRESDVDLERQLAAVMPISSPPTALSSPNRARHGAASPDEEPEVDMAGDPMPSPSSIIRQRALKNAKAKVFWDTVSDMGSAAGGRATQTPAPLFMPRGSSSAPSEDVSMDGSVSGPGSSVIAAATLATPADGTSGSDSRRRSETPQPNHPTAAEMTRRINNKRRRDDDFDPASFKRRAVSPGMSVHNSPVTQSSMQREAWGGRPGSNGHDKAGGSGGKGRVGYQGMVDTSDGMMRMSIE